MPPTSRKDTADAASATAAPSPAARQDPAAVAAAQVEVVGKAMRDTELAQLRRQRDELRQRLNMTDVDELVMLRAEVTALRWAAARAGVLSAPRFGMSEGERADVEQRGYAISPFTGEVRTGADK